MKIAKGDYIILNTAEDGSSKPKMTLGKVRSDNNLSTIVALLQKNVHIKREVVDVPKEKVILNLGADPYPGSYLGLSVVDRYRGVVTTDIGEFHMFTKLNEKEKELLVAGASEVRGLLDSLKLDFVLKDNLVLEIGDVGSYLGMYYHESKKAPYPRIRVCRKGLDKTNTGFSVAYVLAHELGHALDYGWVSKGEKPRAAWVSMFKKSTEAKEFTAKELARVLNTIKHNDFGENKTVRELAGLLDADDVPMLKAAVKWIKQNRQVDIKDLNALVSSADVESFTELWPRHSISVKDLNPILTEYATKNSRELFAETFAAYLTGMKLPPELAALVEKSIRFARNQNKDNDA